MHFFLEWKNKQFSLAFFE